MASANTFPSIIVPLISSLKNAISTILCSAVQCCHVCSACKLVNIAFDMSALLW